MGLLDENVVFLGKGLTDVGMEGISCCAGRNNSAFLGELFFIDGVVGGIIKVLKDGALLGMFAVAQTTLLLETKLVGRESAGHDGMLT